MEETQLIWFVLTILVSFFGGYSAGGPSRLDRKEWDEKAIRHFAIRDATKMECPHCNELVDLGVGTSSVAEYTVFGRKFGGDKWNPVCMRTEAWLNKHEDNEDDDE